MELSPGGVSRAAGRLFGGHNRPYSAHCRVMRTRLFWLLNRTLEDWLILALLLATAVYLLLSERFWSWSERVLPF